MQRIKGFVKSNTAKNQFQTIFWGQPTNQDYQGAIKRFNTLNSKKKTQIEGRIMKKMKKGKQSKIALSILHFVGLLIHEGYRYPFLYDLKPNIRVKSTKNKLQQEIQKKEYKIYLKFVQFQSRKPITLKHRFQQLTLEQQIAYCEIATSQIKQIIHDSEQILDHVKFSQNKIISLIILNFILKTISQDLHFLNLIFMKNYQSIFKEGENILQLNYIYEGLVWVSKEEIFNRILMMNKQLQNKFTFQKYVMNYELNYHIEETMKKYQNEYREYHVGKLLGKNTYFEENPQEQLHSESDLSDDLLLLQSCQ